MIVPRNKYININPKVKQDILHNRENLNKITILFIILYLSTVLWIHFNA